MSQEPDKAEGKGPEVFERHVDIDAPEFINQFVQLWAILSKDKFTNSKVQSRILYKLVLPCLTTSVVQQKFNLPPVLGDALPEVTPEMTAWMDELIEQSASLFTGDVSNTLRRLADQLDRRE